MIIMAGDFKYSIGVYAFYFGKFPEWMPLYLESLRLNSSIDFHIFTDCAYDGDYPKNVFIHNVVYDEYTKYIGEKLRIDFNPDSPIKLCDVRPMVGYIHYDTFSKYDFYGWIDLDLLLGNVRNFYTDEILMRNDVLSTHEVRIAGHFSLFRNNRHNRMMFRKIYQWKESLETPSFIGLDEHGITNAYLLTIVDRFNQKFHTNIHNPITNYISARKKKRMYMVEQHTTPFTPIPWLDGTTNSDQPDEWYFKNGEITNKRDGERTFIYLHFMNFKSNIWRHDGTKAPWSVMDKICHASVADMVSTGISIGINGIYPLK